MCLDYTYCTRECEEMNCKHNKKHLEKIEVNGCKAVSAVSWSNFIECEKGR